LLFFWEAFKNRKEASFNLTVTVKSNTDFHTLAVKLFILFFGFGFSRDEGFHLVLFLAWRNR
jgi:hypothetical protein